MAPEELSSKASDSREAMAVEDMVLELRVLVVERQAPKVRVAMVSSMAEAAVAMPAHLAACTRPHVA